MNFNLKLESSSWTTQPESVGASHGAGGRRYEGPGALAAEWAPGPGPPSPHPVPSSTKINTQAYASGFNLTRKVTPLAVSVTPLAPTSSYSLSIMPVHTHAVVITGTGMVTVPA